MMAELVALPALPAEDMQRGGSPLLVADELKYKIMYAAANAPRSLQTQIGPSQVGTPCDRKLALMVTETASLDMRGSASWASTLGTAMHGWLQETFMMDNVNNSSAGNIPRWLVEMRVNVGEIDGKPCLGNADLYDRVTCGVWDWKLTGTKTIQKAKANGPARNYRVQAQLYGRGFIRRGVPVDYVGIAYLPRNGSTVGDGFFWAEPYNPELAESALQRASALSVAMRTAGPNVLLPALATQDDYCTSCPWFVPGIPVASVQGCPGHNRTPAIPPDGNDILKG